MKTMNENRNTPTIWLDMDGTIADLYSVPEWLTMLRAENTRPYREARLLLTADQIEFLQDFIRRGGNVGIISWTSKCGSAEYNKRVRAAKVNWLKRNLPLPYAEIHVVKHGTPKSAFGKPGDYLVDDEPQNLADFTADGTKFAFHPSEWEQLIDHIAYYHQGMKNED